MESWVHDIQSAHSKWRAECIISSLQRISGELSTSHPVCKELAERWVHSIQSAKKWVYAYRQFMTTPLFWCWCFVSQNMTTRIPVDRSILLIRNPYEAILAEFNRRSSKEEVLRNTAISPERRFKDGESVCLHTAWGSCPAGRTIVPVTLNFAGLWHSSRSYGLSDLGFLRQHKKDRKKEEK